MRTHTLAWAAMLLGGAAPMAASAQQAEPAAAVPMAKPETAGMSSAELAKIDAAMQALVDQKKLAGVVTLVARKGKVVHLHATGQRDLSTPGALQTDSIFRIASMTKPITGVAMMMLWEEGRWKLGDPVSKYIPEFKDLKVKAADGSLVAQAHPMTMRELMSHTAGFDVSAGYEATPLNATDLQGMIDTLAKLPLADQPGSDWNYGPSVNIQGYIVEKLSGMSLDQFFQQRIFTPLGMKDTQFWVAPEKANRVTPVNAYKDGVIVPLEPALPVVTAKPRFLAGSGGLYSTAPDYWRFAQMLQNGGTFEGKRLLKPATVKLMATSVLQPGVMVDLYGPSEGGIGFGMDFAVVEDPAAAKTPQGKGSYYWGGAFGTWFWIDPAKDIIMVGMIQNIRGSTPNTGTPAMRTISYPLVYGAIAGGK